VEVAAEQASGRLDPATTGPVVCMRIAARAQSGPEGQTRPLQQGGRAPETVPSGRNRSRTTAGGAQARGWSALAAQGQGGSSRDSGQAYTVSKPKVPQQCGPPRQSPGASAPQPSTGAAAPGESAPRTPSRRASSNWGKANQRLGRGDRAATARQGRQGQQPGQPPPFFPCRQAYHQQGQQ